MSGGFGDSCCRGRAGEGFGLGVKLKSSESNPYSLHHHMMVDHDQSRPFPSCGEDVYNVVAVPGFGVRTMQQPFDHHHNHHHHLSAFKSPAAGGVAASLGFPFTDAQWKELQRQAMIYKYMMASVPVPPDLFMPIARSLSVPGSAAATSQSPLGGGFKLRFSGGTDPEPGRCRRTDGKKWRCSRDVAPDQKYCERHLHRGRPRSRKPVEHNANNTSTTTAKKAKLSHHQSLTLPIPTPPLTADCSDPSTISSYGCAAPQAYHELSHQQIMGLDKSGERDTTLELVPRGLEWMLMKPSPSSPMAPLCPLNLNSHYKEDKNCISPSSLTLSINTNNNKNDIEDHEKIRMGLGETGLNQEQDYINNWISSPLAEVLRPSSYNVGGGSNVSFEEASTVSSPSGVLQKNTVSFSDSSGSSSPTRLGGSGARPEMALPMQWLNQRGN